MMREVRTGCDSGTAKGQNYATTRFSTSYAQVAFGIFSVYRWHPARFRHPHAPTMSAEPVNYVFVATQDSPEHGIVAGDMFLWQQTPDAGAKVRQLRQWRDASSLLGLVGEVLRPVSEAPPELLIRAVGSHPTAHPSRGLRVVE